MGQSGRCALWIPAETGGPADDGFVVTAPSGRYRPNAWGLYDLHGNVAEWTRSAYRPYPYRDDDGRNDTRAEANRVARGGSFFDPPARARSGARLDYPEWRRIFNVGFRVVCLNPDVQRRPGAASGTLSESAPSR